MPSPTSPKSSSSSKDGNPSTPKRPTRAKTPTSTRKTGTGTPVKTPGKMLAPRTPSRNVPQTPTRNNPQTPVRLLHTPAKSINPSSPSGFAAMSEFDLSSPLNYGTPLSSVRTPHSGIQGTPIRMRFDIRNDKTLRQVALTEQPTETSVESAPAQFVIYGTDVVINECKAKFKMFLKKFLEGNPEVDERFPNLDTTKPLYMQILERIHNLEDPFLNLNCAHLQTFDLALYNQLVRYPQEVIPTFDMAANETFFESYPAATLNHQIQVRPFNASKTRNMRCLDPEDIDQLITISGMVTRTSGIIPELREGLFECQVCDYTCTSEVERGFISEPIVCTHCQSKHCFSLIHNRSQFTDKQLIKLQESPEDSPAGETPPIIKVFAYNDLVDQIKAGDRVSVTGIFRAVSKQVNPRQRNIRAVFTTHVDAVHFRRIDDSRLFLQDSDDSKKEHLYPTGRIEQIQNLSKIPDIYEQLARAIAPSIYENEDVKKGILLLLFGGARKDFSKYGRGQSRAELNMLLCGDPGTSKSQLLQYVYHLLPRSQYTSGKGSSAVGLTAYLSKDPDTKHHVLHSGALVLADNGVCCIDEFDKMDDSTRSVLHEVMEQQTLSIAKAGIVCQLTARTSILAAANPSGSQWNKDKTIIENIQLPHTLLSRFDLIFLMLDPQNEIFDRRLARHLISLYYTKKTDETEEDDADISIDMKLLRDYIAYAKEHVQPRLSRSAGTLLVQKYVQMRQQGAGHGQVSAYPRQLESLIRLSEAHARMRLNPTVENYDVEEAYRLHREALKQSATDPLSGRIDVGILTTGLSVMARQRRAEIIKILTHMIEELKARSLPVNQQKLLEELRTKTETVVTREAFEDALRELQDQQIITIVGKNTIRIL